MSTSTENLLDDYWTESQLAEQVQRSKRTVERWRELRIGPPATPLGRAWIYSKPSARNWLRSNELPSPRARRQRTTRRTSRAQRAHGDVLLLRTAGADPVDGRAPGPAARPHERGAGPARARGIGSEERSTSVGPRVRDGPTSPPEVPSAERIAGRVERRREH